MNSVECQYLKPCANETINVSNTWDHFTVCKQMLNILETIWLCKQVRSDSFENKITHKLFTYKLYIYNNSTVCKQMTDVKLLMLHNNTRDYLTVCKEISSSLFKNVIYELV